jgi:hypothetical protein
MQDENNLGPVVDISDQPAPVAADVENNASSDAIDILPTLF